MYIKPYIQFVLCSDGRRVGLIPLFYIMYSFDGLLGFIHLIFFSRREIAANSPHSLSAPFS
jgi:hypothetical protein